MAPARPHPSKRNERAAKPAPFPTDHLLFPAVARADTAPLGAPDARPRPLALFIVLGGIVAAVFAFLESKTSRPNGTPIFLMVGGIRDVPVRDGDGMGWGRQMTIRVSYDERINDGLSAFRGVESIKQVLADPDRWLGCLQDDPAEHRSLLATPPTS